MTIEDTWMLLSTSMQNQILPVVLEKIETALDTAEHVANIVEEAAEDVAKVAEGAVNHLPEGKLHDAAESAAKLAEEIDEDAQKAEKRLRKVEELGKEVKSRKCREDYRRERSKLEENKTADQYAI